MGALNELDWFAALGGENCGSQSRLETNGLLDQVSLHREREACGWS